MSNINKREFRQLVSGIVDESLHANKMYELHKEHNGKLLANYFRGRYIGLRYALYKLNDIGNKKGWYN